MTEQRNWGTVWRVLSAATCITVLLVAGVVAAAPPPAAPAVAPPPTTGPGGPGTYILLAWNDLGMHCYNRDFADIAVLPPFTNLWAQAILIGDPPRVVTTGVTITYSIWDNSNSVGKSNFWTYAQKLFGLAAPLPADVGLTGKKLNDTMDSAPDHFEAVGIPLTEFLDSAPSTPYPYQLAVITLTDSTTSEFLARAVAVAPVSTEMMCSNCHGDTGSATTAYPITPTGKVETNILTLHDYIHQAIISRGPHRAAHGSRPPAHPLRRVPRHQRPGTRGRAGRPQSCQCHAQWPQKRAGNHTGHRRLLLLPPWATDPVPARLHVA